MWLGFTVRLQHSTPFILCMTDSRVILPRHSVNIYFKGSLGVRKTDSPYEWSIQTWITFTCVRHIYYWLYCSCWPFYYFWISKLAGLVLRWYLEWLYNISLFFNDTLYYRLPLLIDYFLLLSLLYCWIIGHTSHGA